MAAKFRSPITTLGGISAWTAMMIVFLVTSAHASGMLFQLDEYVVRCDYTAITARHTALGSRYKFTGTCFSGEDPAREYPGNTQFKVPWIAEGTFDPASGEVNERITLTAPHSGYFTLKTFCNDARGAFDPWSRPQSNDIAGPCTPAPLVAHGASKELVNLMTKLSDLARTGAVPFTAATHPYDRSTLVVKRESDRLAGVSRDAGAHSEIQVIAHASAADKGAPRRVTRSPKR